MIARLSAAGCIAPEEEAGALLSAGPDDRMLDGWLRRCLARNAGDRFATADETYDELRRALSQSPSVAGSSATARTVDLGAAAPPPVVSPASSAETRPRGRRALWIAIVTVGITP